MTVRVFVLFSTLWYFQEFEILSRREGISQETCACINKKITGSTIVYYEGIDRRWHT
jgi:hypothetical protein